MTRGTSSSPNPSRNTRSGGGGRDGGQNKREARLRAAALLSDPNAPIPAAADMMIGGAAKPSARRRTSARIHQRAAAGRYRSMVPLLEEEEPPGRMFQCVVSPVENVGPFFESNVHDFLGSLVSKYGIGWTWNPWCFITCVDPLGNRALKWENPSCIRYSWIWWAWYFGLL